MTLKICHKFSKAFYAFQTVCTYFNLIIIVYSIFKKNLCLFNSKFVFKLHFASKIFMFHYNIDNNIFILIPYIFRRFAELSIQLSSLMDISIVNHNVADVRYFSCKKLSWRYYFLHISIKYDVLTLQILDKGSPSFSFRVRWRITSLNENVYLSNLIIIWIENSLLMTGCQISERFEIEYPKLQSSFQHVFTLYKSSETTWQITLSNDWGNQLSIKRSGRV